MSEKTVLKSRYFFGTVHSYDEFLATTLLQFLHSMMAGDIDMAEEVMLTLVSALPKDAKYDSDGREGALTIIKRYTKERDKLVEELARCQTLKCKEHTRLKIKELIRETFSKITDLMDEAGLLVRRYETRIPIVSYKKGVQD